MTQASDISDVRLIERWMPIAALGEESLRERRSLSALPAVYYLHTWWARRPLVASRAAILASLLPTNANRSSFMHCLGIHGDPIATKRAIDRAKRTGENLGSNPYGYDRAFKYQPTAKDLAWLKQSALGSVLLDPTAGGGSIPFEGVRLGLNVFANDLNPVAALIEKATVEYPFLFGLEVLSEFDSLSKRFLEIANKRFEHVYPAEKPDTQVLGYIWSRTVKCPYCDGVVPLAQAWKLAADGTGLQISPICGTGPGDSKRNCEFTVVSSVAEQSPATIADGDGLCPFPDCNRPIGGDHIKKEAQSGRMGDKLVAIAYRFRTRSKGKNGRPKWERGYRAASAVDDNQAHVRNVLSELADEWTALDIIPNEEIGVPSNYDRGHRLYGMKAWRDLFSPRQLLCHGLGVQIFRELLGEYQGGSTTDVVRAAFVYLAMSLDKLTVYNARSSFWDATTGRIRQVFSNHNYSMTWTYAEFAGARTGAGFEWVLGQTQSALKELISITQHDPASSDLFASLKTPPVKTALTLSCESGESLGHIPDGSIDIVVMDPPYYDNVMYAELSDFFYVWLKRTAALVVPELFTRSLTDKEREAVANPAKFNDGSGARSKAGRDYQDRMQRIFEECRRVLSEGGIMTLMFTHKATGAWDALTKGLMEAGFTITASWPISTEAESSLHIRNKAAANSTIFLTCRPRLKQSSDFAYWEDVEPLLSKAVRTRISEFQEAGVAGVDLYLASFGPALEEFSKHWPLKRGTPRPEPLAKRRRKQAEMFEEPFDPYAVTPEDALEAARREVKTWRLNQLTHLRGKEDLDSATSFYVLAWDAFKAPVFAYDEGLRLARAVGADLDQLIGRICEKKGSDIKLWDSKTRSEKGSLGAGDGTRGMIDALQYAAHRGRTRSIEAAREFIKDAGMTDDPAFMNALEAILEVLPPSSTFTQIELSGDLKNASDDFDALEKLRRLAFADRVDEPQQLKLWQEEPVA
ncbi:DUF1156 domain-containing protein [Methylocystis sp. H62]|uniref:DUF1156 domain-containing protein n=1 Tax=Methylocystis sp. H62 TaxID=2785789 RepID=UPI0018C288A0|nr:DUF1156 domain-containing protein [Methylocystis sp. H62]MBG0794732.1 DUF1156 domain-containing protein [Methylocystis sp. H62]